MMNKEQNYFESNMKILEFAMKQWKLLLGVLLVAAVMATVFSSARFIPPVYTSKAAVYPANLGNYSGETQLEQLMQYLESNVIRDTLIQKFNLYDEYEIDSSMKSSRAIMYKVYEENVHADETQYESVIISASSTDPVKARDMVQEVIDQLNNVVRNTERLKYSEIVDINKKMLDQKKRQLDSLQGLIRDISTKYGLLDYISQSEEVTEGYMRFLINGKKGNDFDEAKKLYSNLEEHGRHFHNLHAQLNIVNEEFMERSTSYEHALKDLNKVQSYTNVIVHPEVPDKKSYPIRWLIVLVAAASSCFFAFVVLLFLGYHKK